MKGLIALAAILLGQPVFAANKYVDVVSTGANNGTSWENAWQDFGSITWSSISPGDTVFISGGVDTAYYQDILDIDKAGKGNAPIVFTIGRDPGHDGIAYLTQKVRAWYSKGGWILDGSNNDSLRHIVVSDTGTGHNISIYLSDSIQVKNVECRYNKDHGIAINTSYFISIYNCHIHHTLWDGININSRALPDSITAGLVDTFGVFIIDRCIIDSCGDDLVQTGSERVTLKNSFIRYAYNAVPNPYNPHPDGIQTGVGAGYYKVYSNIFVNCPQGVFLEGTEGVSRIYNNVFYDVTDELPEVTTNRFISANKRYADSPADVVIANNVFYNSLWSAIYMPPPGYASDELVFRNNIFLNCKRWIGGEGYNANPGLLQGIDNILFTKPDAPVPAQALPDSGLNVDPLFVDYENHDFRLQAASPARGAGTNLSEFFAVDFYHAQRPATGAWDIGAAQYESTGSRYLPEREALIAPAAVRPEYYTIAGRRIAAGQTMSAGIYLVRSYHGQLLKKVLVTPMRSGLK